jgi:L-ascorbate metabolism protein UlaG (beta-lactamase superfamily)
MGMLAGKSPEKNAILFVWLNHYSGVMIKTPSKTLVIDPVDVKTRNLDDVDAILISHEHYDHLDQLLVSEVNKLTDCLVVADRTSARRLKHNIMPQKLQEVQAGSEVKIGDVTIRAEKSNHPAASPVTFSVTSEDGVKVFHTSDSLPYPEMAQMSENKFDVVFCTVGIAPGASPETGFEIARLTKPQVAVPYHTNSSSSQKEFVEILRRGLPKTAYLVPEQNKIYQVGKRI